MIRITVLALALAAPLYGGFVGPAIPLSTPVFEPAPGFRGAPRVASNGREFLVVWNDLESLYATRVDANGVVRDRDPLLLRARSFSSPVDVASDGRDYLVTSPCGTSLCLLHVDAETGAASARGAIPHAGEAAIESNGRGYLVVYKTTDSSLVEAIPLRADGSIAGPAYSVGRSSFPPALASNGEHYFVVFGTLSQSAGVLLSETGYAADQQRFAESSMTGWFDVTSDGDGFLVTWGERGGARGSELHAAPVSRNGVLSSRKTIHPIAGQHSVAWNGSRYLLAYTPLDLPDVTAFEVSAAGDAVSEPVAVAAGPDQEVSSAMASNGQATLAAWTHQWKEGAQIEARFITPDGLGPPFVVSWNVTDQDSVAAMRHGAQTIVAWDENKGPRQLRKVFVQRLDANGAPLDGRGLPVGDSPRHQLRPALAGSLVAWVETSAPNEADARVEVWATLLDDSGRPSGSTFRIGVTAWAATVAVVSPGDGADVVLWTTKERQLMATRVLSNGIYGPLSQLASGFFITDPAAATNGAGFLAAWNDGRLYTGAFTQSAQPLGPSTLFDYDFRRALVWNGESYVLFWSRSSDEQAVAQQISAAGVPIGAPHVLGHYTVDAAVWTGEEYLIAFDQDFQGGPLSLARLARDFTPIATYRTFENLDVDRSVVLLDDLLITLAPYRGDDLRHTRVVARRIGVNASPPRRRAAR